jgi:SAM-dependent MidA family methyltransferase
MPAAPEPAPLAAIVADRIRAHGPITFAEYMEACLYHPQHGYYTKSNQQPRRDYFTSVDAAPLFGRLLARQFHQMWIQLGSPHPFTLVEAGAGTGALAGQILDFTADSLPEFYAVLSYVAVERSAGRCAIHRQALAAHLARGKALSAPQMPSTVATGCIFSNELFDAMPVHRVTVVSGELREVFVGLSGSRFCDVLGAPSSPKLAEYLAGQGITLAEDQHAEICLEASSWIEGAAKSLERGFVLTIDYGHEASELYDDRHMRGTLLAYSRHRASEDYFRSPGEQDLTAHVNFTALDLRGCAVGLTRSGFTSQTNFLMALARRSNFADLQTDAMTEQQQSRARLLFKTLINPEGMGEALQVLIQHKNTDPPNLAGLEPI